MSQIEIAPDAQPIRRFPRLSSEDAAAAERTENRIAELDAQVFRGLARRREVTIEVGRALNELKKLLGHGKWKHHFAETFAPSGFNQRTAQRYMKRARKVDADLENDTVSLLKKATDRGAQEIKDATNQAEEEANSLSSHRNLQKEPLRLDGIYRLPLHMTGDEKDAMDALRELPDWPRAEKKIVSLLKRLWVEYGIVNKNVRRKS